MDIDVQNADFQRLHELIEGSADIKDFLDSMARHAASSLSRASGVPIACAVTLLRRKRTVTVAGSSDEAVVLDRIEQDLGEGSCLEALRTAGTVLLADAGTDTRWPRYSWGLAAADYSSVLGVPVASGETSSASLNFFAPPPGCSPRKPSPRLWCSPARQGRPCGWPFALLPRNCWPLT